MNTTLFETHVGTCLEKKRLRNMEIEYLHQIEAEKNRADAILYATLPAAVVEELKATNRVRPRRFENVVVLFSDVTGFTGYCDTQSPEDVVNHLRELVTAFEEIAERHGLQKIKTIIASSSMTSTRGGAAHQAWVPAQIGEDNSVAIL